ncbi:ROK family protein [Bifidobacterium sp. MA2]|uniref:ROK family protein n=1 Tax=Bifidobacterium santillanense TaxID=2809028 RepID=A0ABS5UPK0_9BIFI|nr:ROK family protein [Bifidobacterium santillanense]MBT1172735.1 ROK family protein [Bifidobacterium santillanense]
MPVARRINQDDLRNHNMAVVLSAMARSREPMSRADLAKETGLTKATITLLVDILLKNHVIRQLEPAVGAAYGRPSTPLAFASGRWCGLGMQINTDGFGYVALDLTGDVVDSGWRERTMDGTAPDDVFGELDRMVRPAEERLAARGYTVAGAELALPGLVTNGNTLLAARNLGWRDVSLDRYDVFSRLGANAENEATLAAIAQIPGYAAQRDDGDWPLGPADSFVYVSTDIGIGGAYVREGQVVRGDHGFAGEIGHVCVDMQGARCRCGRHGCLEMYAGRRALMVESGLADECDATDTALTPRLIEAWRDGDAETALAVERATAALASALTSVVNIVDVERIVIGGLLAEFGDAMVEGLRERIQSQILARESVHVRVLRAPVTDHPALRGAAVMGLSRLMRGPLPFMTV